jgi:hypothetical protein
MIEIPDGSGGFTGGGSKGPGPMTAPQPEPIDLPNPGPFIPQTTPPGQDLPEPAEPVQTPVM